jgi:hypothetical protein
MLIELTYFKKSGKYYTQGKYESEFTQMHDVFDEVRSMPYLPGLVGN